jgi:hypothetical protein
MPRFQAWITAQRAKTVRAAAPSTRNIRGKSLIFGSVQVGTDSAFLWMERQQIGAL